MADGLVMKIGVDASELKKGISQAMNSLKSLSGAALKGGALVTGALAAMGVGKGLKLAAEMQTLEVAFGVLTGSAEKARGVIAELTQLSDSTPLEPEDVISAGRSLLAFGFGADEVAKQLRMVGDIASGVGAPLGEVAEIYGKARVQGRLFAEDINQLTGRGIPVIEALAGVLGVSSNQVKKLTEEGKVGFPELQSAFTAMTSDGGKFAGMMAKQSQTFTGTLSTLKGKISAVLRDSMRPVLDALIPVMKNAISMMDALKPKFEAIGAWIGNSAALLIEAFQRGEILKLLGSGLQAGALFLGDTLTKAIRSGVVLIGTVLASILQGFVTKLKDSQWWLGLFEVLKGTLMSVVAAMKLLIAEMIPGATGARMKFEAQDRQLTAALQREVGIARMDKAGNGQSLGEMLGGALKQGMGAAQKEWAEKTVFSDSLAKVLAGMKGSFSSYQASVDAAKAARKAAAEEAGKTAAAKPKTELTNKPGLIDSFMQSVTSMQRIGGAKLTGPNINLDRERNAMLKSIEKNTRRPSVAVLA